MEQTIAQNKMGVKPIPKLLLSMGLPMIVSMMIQAFYNIVDSFFGSPPACAGKSSYVAQRKIL